MMKVKLIGMDLDGTLLTSKKELTAYTKEILSRAVKQGIIVMPATGRPLKGITDDLLEFSGFRYAVTANGGRVVKLRTGEALFEELVPEYVLWRRPGRCWRFLDITIRFERFILTA